MKRNSAGGKKQNMSITVNVRRQRDIDNFYANAQRQAQPAKRRRARRRS